MTAPTPRARRPLALVVAAALVLAVASALAAGTGPARAQAPGPVLGDLVITPEAGQLDETFFQWSVGDACPTGTASTQLRLYGVDHPVNPGWMALNDALGVTNPLAYGNQLSPSIATRAQQQGVALTDGTYDLKLVCRPLSPVAADLGEWSLALELAGTSDMSTATYAVVGSGSGSTTTTTTSTTVPGGSTTTTSTTTTVPGQAPTMRVFDADGVEVTGTVEVARGGVLLVLGQGFPAGGAVELLGDDVVLGGVTADEAGTVGILLVIAVDAEPGEHTMTLRGEGGEVSRAVVITDEVVATVLAHDGDGQVVADGATLAPGQSVAVTATGFEAGEEVAVGLEPSGRDLGTTTAAADTSATWELTVPDDLEPGEHALVLAGSAHEARFRFVVAGEATTTTTTTLAGAPVTDPLVGEPTTWEAVDPGTTAGTGTLPVTGAALATTLAVVGAALTGGGYGALRWVRRRGYDSFDRPPT